MTSSQDWEIPRKIWAVLASWGLAVLVIVGLLSFWIWKNDRDQERERSQLQLEQDLAMCAIVRLVAGAPVPPPGSEGDRAREFRQAMDAYGMALHCRELEAANPGGPGRDLD